MEKPKRHGRFTMLIIDQSIVTVGAKWRSKWWSVACTCGVARRRKDGTCKHERLVLGGLVPAIKPLARIRVNQQEGE